MKISTLLVAVDRILRHNQNTRTTDLFVPKYRQYSQTSSVVGYSHFTKAQSEQNFSKHMNTKRRKTQLKTSGGDVTITIYGTGSNGTSRSLFLQTSITNYVFNCGEGMQRLSQEHKIKLARVRRAFITSCKWENIGGIIGLGLTLDTIGIKPVYIHGPKCLASVLKPNRVNTQIANINLDVIDYTETETYSDIMVTIWHVPIESNVTSSIEDYIKDVDKEATEIIDGSSNKRTMSNDGGPRKLLKTDNPKIPAEVVCYICKMADRPGTLNLSKCVDLGVKPGPLLGKLKQGEDVTLENGTVIRSNEVCSTKIQGPVFLVVDVPSKSYLESFLNAEKFKEYQNPDNEYGVAYVFHFTPREIINDPQYIDWMAKFESETQHVVLDENSYTIGSEAIVRNQCKLNLINPKIFPKLPNIEGENEEPNRNINITDKEGNLLKVYVPNALDLLHLYPKGKRCTEQNIKLMPEAYIAECLEIPGFSELLSSVHDKVEAHKKSLPNVNVEYPKVVMLGTGCSVPCKYRNTSGILLRTDENNSILMDCGEGIHGQIQRRYNKSEYETVMKSIKGIYISHLHADHHLGLLSILLKRAKLTKDQICIIAPENYWSWLQLYHTNAEQILDSVKFYSSECMHFSQRDLNWEDNALLFKYLNIDEISTTKVKHAACAFGVSVTLKTGEKITYSGDTMPSNNLIALGANSDLLIHEASMDDSLIELARKSQHTTTSQAIEVGRQMNAKMTLLTHFSQRYAKVPYIPGGIDSLDLKSVGIAYDFMDISLSQISLLPLFNPVMLTMFADTFEEHEMRVAKNLRKLNGKDRLVNSLEL